MADGDPRSEALAVPSVSGAAAASLTESWLPTIDGSAESRSIQAAARRLIRGIVWASWNRTGVKPEPIDIYRLLQTDLTGSDSVDVLLSEFPDQALVTEIAELRHATHCWVALENRSPIVTIQAVMLLDRLGASR
jgi:hypothetical protein